MTAEHTSDSDAVSTPAPKAPRRTTAKAVTRKKTPSSSTVTVEEDSSTPQSEKKKTPARRPRKKTPSSAAISDAENVSAVQESTPLAIPKEASAAEKDAAQSESPKPKRGRKPAVRAKNKEKTEKNEEFSTEEKNTSKMSSGDTNSLGTGVMHSAVEQEKSADEPLSADLGGAQKKSPRAGRGRPKKITSPAPVENDQEKIVLSSISDEPQSAGIARETSEVPDVPSSREEKKTRRPRRGAKAKLSPVSQENVVTPEQAQEENTAHAVEEEASLDATASRSRRGRRGGRGKRGKKRPLTPTEALQEFMDDEDDEQIMLTSKAAPLAKGGTSLGEGKPGRARTTAVKKTVENVQRKMFISMVQGEQVEVALVENGVIHEYYLEMLHQVKTKGNIYKGVVNNIDANLQAAFVNYGANKNGFLQIDEIHPEYYQSHHEVVKGKKFPPIQKIIKPGQEILVQVVKEPTGNKGAFLTTWLSLPGRFLVLTPGQEQIGISRKVESDEERGRLREMMTGIEPGAGLGVIVRTVSAGTSKTTLKSDLQYLKRVWREIRKRGVSDAAPVLLYRESGLAERAIRDYLTDDVTEVWVDSTEVAERLRETVSLLFPRKKELIRMHADVRQTLWERFNMQRQLEQIYSREVVLPSGGRLVFDQTEALMAIDINSGKISGKGNFESMALKTNIEAAEAIARHLKLRDIGGQVVIDFIEMRDKSHVREVEKTLRNAMKNDRARHDVARISSFGLLEIVRQRTGSSALAITMEPCPHCKGTGVRRNLEWQALQALCEMERKGRSAQHGKYVYETSFAELALYLLNHKRQRISELEEQLRISIEVRIQ